MSANIDTTELNLFLLNHKFVKSHTNRITQYTNPNYSYEPYPITYINNVYTNASSLIKCDGIDNSLTLLKEADAKIKIYKDMDKVVYGDNYVPDLKTTVQAEYYHCFDDILNLELFSPQLLNHVKSKANDYNDFLQILFNKFPVISPLIIDALDYFRESEICYYKMIDAVNKGHKLFAFEFFDELVEHNVYQNHITVIYKQLLVKNKECIDKLTCFESKSYKIIEYLHKTIIKTNYSKVKSECLRYNEEVKINTFIYYYNNDSNFSFL